jgi:sugar phosphate isomerase/epimerase
MKDNQIALQLYTVREHTAVDMLGTLRAVAEMGYTAVEFAGYGSYTPRDLRAALEEYGLRAAGAHVSLVDWEYEPEAVVSDLRTLDCAHAVVPIVPEERRRGEEAVRRIAESFNRWGELCRSAGLTFSYHNHDFEFAPLTGQQDEKTMWDMLLHDTDPDLVNLELDLYWIRHAGADPETLLRHLTGRVSLVHLKDMASDPACSDAPVGEGTMPWPELLTASETAGAEWYVVEQDHPRDALEDVQRSLENLRKMTKRLRQ